MIPLTKFEISAEKLRSDKFLTQMEDNLDSWAQEL